MKTEEVIHRKTEARKFHIETYGCAMNLADSDVVASIMQGEGYLSTDKIEEADIIFINTCSIRDKAEKTIRHRLSQFNQIKKHRPGMIIGILGCMAERLKTQLLEEEKNVDLVVGPDAYRDLASLVKEVDAGHKAVNTLLSREETYADINPVRLGSNGISAMISITRGCNNMCSFCVVPFTRGRERSRDPYSIINEIKDLQKEGYKEITLLGQNVDSYKWSPNLELKGKAQIEKARDAEVITFAQLLEMSAKVDPEIRIRFSTSHPKDITDEVLYTIKKYDNICNYIHLPAQSGSSKILNLMKRTYDREWYLGKIAKIKEILGEECGVSSDMISGFCSETEEDHQDTLSLMDIVKFDFSYMFFYSERPGTYAEKKLKDDIPEPIKKRRLQEIIDKQRGHSLERNKLDLNKVHRVLIEGYSKRSEEQLQGRNDANKVVIFPKEQFKKGQYVDVLISECTGGTLIGNAVKS